MKTILSTFLFFNNRIDLEMPETGSPNTLLFGLMFFLLIGVMSAIYIVLKNSAEKKPTLHFTVNEA